MTYSWLLLGLMSQVHESTVRKNLHKLDLHGRHPRRTTLLSRKNFKARLMFAHEHLGKVQLWKDKAKIDLFDSISPEKPDTKGKAWWRKCYSSGCFVAWILHCIRGCLRIMWDHQSEDCSSTQSEPFNMTVTLNISVNLPSNGWRKKQRRKFLMARSEPRWNLSISFIQLKKNFMGVCGEKLFPVYVRDWYIVWRNICLRLFLPKGQMLKSRDALAFPTKQQQKEMVHLLNFGWINAFYFS